MKAATSTLEPPLEESVRSNRELPRTTMAARAILMVAILLTFGRACTYDFVNLDDRQVVVRNPLMNPVTPHSFKVWWTTPQFQLYDPLTATVRAAIASLARVPPDPQTGDALNPWVFHTVNLLLHMGVTLLVYQLLLYLRIRPWPACGGAMLFAIHPVQVEPVVWITSVKDLLYGTFALLAIWRLLISLEDRSGGAQPHAAGGANATSGVGNYLLATLCFVLAVLSKPTAVIVPLLALPLVWLACRRISMRAWIRLGIWCLIALPFILIAKSAQPAPYAQRLVPWQRFLVAGDALAFYLFQIIWPKTLLLYYGRTPGYILRYGFIWWTWIAPATIFAILWVNRRRCPSALAGMSIFAVGLLPILGFVGFEFQYYSTVADRYLYIPMFGIALIAASALDRVPKGYGAMWGILLVILAMRSFAQVLYWQNSLTLFNHVLDYDPRSAVSHAGLAVVFADQGDYDRSIEYARRSIALDPHRCEPYVTLAKSLDVTGNTAAAIEAFRAGFRADARMKGPLNDYTAALVRHGDARHALAFAELSAELFPRVSTYVNLGVALAKTNDWQGAKRELQSAAALDPNDYKAQCNLASVLLHLGDLAGARLHYELAVSIDPENPAALAGLKQLVSHAATQPVTSQP